MESFYGGQQGFSFVVKRNPAEDHDGYFYNVNEINKAASEGVLRYGDYAIVTNTINDYTKEHGDLYRINTRGMAEKVANISHPALATLISEIGEFDDQAGEGQTVTIPFLYTSDSQNANGLKISWVYETNEEEVSGIKLGIEAPQPVINATLTQKTLDLENPIAIASNDNILNKTHDERNTPFLYDFQIQLPMRSVLIPQDQERVLNNLNNLDAGTLCFMTSDVLGKWMFQPFFNTNHQNGRSGAWGVTNGFYFLVPFDMTENTKFRISTTIGNNINWQCQYWIVTYESSGQPTPPENWIDPALDTMQSIKQVFTIPTFQSTDNQKRAIYLWIGAEDITKSLTKDDFKNFILKVAK